MQENAAVEEQLLSQMVQQPELPTVLDPASVKMELEKSAKKDSAAGDFTDKAPVEALLDINSYSRNDYLCAFCHFIFTTKAGYMEHTKLGNCIQVSPNFWKKKFHKGFY